MYDFSGYELSHSCLPSEWLAPFGEVTWPLMRKGGAKDRGNNGVSR